jgi:hypothetical protein
MSCEPLPSLRYCYEVLRTSLLLNDEVTKQEAIAGVQAELAQVQKRAAASNNDMERVKQETEALVQNNARLERQRDTTLANHQ